ncbi:MAG TPA: hypothetical protein VNN10_14525 [Dehalococcoidia bacterium]|nr:hypothetical protein [Dehalococcoidia bacterium]
MVGGTQIVVGGLAAVALTLAVALGVVLAVDDHDRWHAMDGAHHGAMPGGMEFSDWAAMQQRMREVMGDEAYQRMLGHMTDHAAMHGMMHGATPAMPMTPGWTMPGMVP